VYSEAGAGGRAPEGEGRYYADMFRWLPGVVLLASLGAPATARAQEPVEADELGASTEVFGPVIVIEKIEVVGNESTATRLIRRVLPFAEGDAIRAGDPRLVDARYKVLALGYFRDVALKLARGSKRGHVVLTVVVVERGTVVLERMYFGTTEATPWWAGLDLTERNFFGTGIGIGGGFLVTGEGDVANAEPQWAAQLRFDDPSILGTPFGAFLTLQHIDASEPYRIAGRFSDGAPENFAAVGYTRTGGKVGGIFELTPLSRLSGGARVEVVDARVPAAPTRTTPDGRLESVNLALKPDISRVVTASLAFDRDTRAHPILPWNGSRVAVVAEFGATWLGGSYNYASVVGQFGKWWAVRGPAHVVSLHLTGGLVLGDAPLFDMLYVGDLDKLLTPRELGLVLSTRAPLDLLGTTSDEQRYGEIGGVVESQYSYRLFRGGRRVYGGDLFFGLGLWGLGKRDDLRARDTSAYRALPIDVFIDAGLRLDTEIGIFELSLANGIGRVPL